MKVNFSNSVLVIGNGFDRQIGLNTDYISFLDWLESCNYSEIGLNEIIKQIKLFSGYNLNLIGCADYLDELYADENQKTIDFLKRIYPTKQVYRQDKIHLKFFSLLLRTKNESNIFENENNFNLWFSYFNFLRKLNNQKKINCDIEILFSNLINEEGKWIDLESLIESNIRYILENDSFYSKQTLTIFSFTWYLLLQKNQLWLTDYRDFKDHINELIWAHFVEFKKLLVNYLEIEEKKLYSFLDTKNISFTDDEFPSELIFDSKIINFNYTNTLSKIALHCEEKKTQLKTYFLHGSLNDSKHVVFGLDSYFRDLPSESINGKSNLEIRMLNDSNYVKYSKIHQLLNLQKEKSKFQIGIVDNLTILGHSIGEQDYSYFFSMFDRNISNIEIEYLFYKFNSGSGDNKTSGQDSLFSLINSYEKYSSSRVLHKMIFEGRIKFKEVYIPKLLD